MQSDFGKLRLPQPLMRGVMRQRGDGVVYEKLEG